jgi:hypothetical protein
MKKPDDPLPWKCRVDGRRMAIGDSICDCAVFRPRKRYRQQPIKKYLKRWYKKMGI